MSRRRWASAIAAERVTAGAIDLIDVDGVLVRMMPPGSLEQVVFRMDALHRVAAAGVPVLNPPRAVEAAVDKYLTLALLGPGGPAGPRHLDRPVGRRGAGGVRRAGRRRRRQAALRLGRTGTDPGQRPGAGLADLSCPRAARRVLYLQQVIRHPGYDLRVFVLDGTVLGAMRRYAPASDWRTNVSLGGRAEPCRLSAEDERLAIGAARAVGADRGRRRPDPRPDRGRPVVLEVNAVPGWRALSRVTGVDVAAAVLEAPLKARSRFMIKLLNFQY